MVCIKMARMKQTSRGRGLARGLPTATFTHVRAAMPRITVIDRKANGPPHGHAQGWPNTTAQPREQAPVAAVSSEVEPNIGPLPQPSFGELLYKLDLLRADTRRSIAEWKRKIAELRTAHNSIIDNVGSCCKRCEITKAPLAAQGPHSEPCGWLEGDQNIVFYILNKFVVIISVLY